MLTQHTSLSQQAYDWIKNRIITLEMPPGSALGESEISRELGLGRTPVREAIQQLKSDGLVIVVPRKGTFVSNINFGDFEKILDARIMIELYVARSLAESSGRIDPQKMDNLRRLFDPSPELVEKRDINALLHIDRMFHQGLVLMLENHYITAIAERMYDLVARTWYISFNKRSCDDLLYTIQDHMNIINAIDRGDVIGTEKAVREHILNFRNKIYFQY